MRTLLFALGAAATLVGLLFLAQGTGVFPYPQQSFMIGRPEWSGRGTALAGLGMALMILSRNMSGR